MSRYDWPAGVDAGDDPGARAQYNARHLPPPDVRQDDGSLGPPPPAPKKVPRRRGPKAPPGGGTQLWLPLGPSTVRGGQASGKPNVSGRVRDIAVHPDNGERVYLATASGGVWFSGDTGVSWRPLDEFVVSPGRSTMFPVGNALACGAIEVIWGTATNGSQDEVIVGTGEEGGSAGTPGGKMAGIGILTAVGPATGTGWIQHTGITTVPSDTDDLRGHVVWRIAADPLLNGRLYAATSNGLYSRATTGGSWTREAAVNGEVIDVLVTRSSAPDRVRVWIAQWGSLKVAEGTTGTPANPDLSPAAIQSVPISGFRSDTRLVIGGRDADTVWVLGTGPKDGDRPPARLQRIDASGSITAGNIDTIDGIPKSLFMSASDQSWYDMALGVHPDDPDVVYVGGATTMISGDFNATIYRVEVTGSAGDAVEIGKGVHADVHVLRFGPQRAASTDRAVWVGCDGGVFLSTSDGRAETFVSRNNNLSTLQPGFVACHPTNEGILAAGMQDNGTCDRVGDTVWRESFEGDGGGVVYDPGNANRYFRQYTGATWASSDHTGSGPVFRFASAHAGSEDHESEFYSGAAALTHGGTTHLAVGTNRPWYSPDWGETWVTVPTGTDPRSSVFPDLNQDLLVPVAAPSTACCTPTFDASAKVLTCRFAPLADKDGNHRVLLVVLWHAGLAYFVGSRATASTGAWAWTKAAAHQIRNPIEATDIIDVAAGSPTSFLPAPELVNDVAIHDPKDGADATCYLATTGSKLRPNVDTVYWYDGQGHFVPCATRRSVGTGIWKPGMTRITSPALSVIVDPATPPTHPIVYVGTSVAVIKGTQTFVGGNPHWEWENFENGLPEGAVQDLAIFDSGGVKLLRAALQARGVWETDLDAVVAQPRTILRVNASDSRRRRPTPLTGPSTAGEPNLRYDNSPDIVVDTSSVVWPAFGPDEAELMDARFAGTVGEHAAQALSTRVFRVHVLVHRRWFAAAAPSDVKVALLRHSFPADGSDVLLGGIWDDLLTVAGGPAPGVLQGSWEKAASVLTKAIPAAVDVRLPRAVTFDVNLADITQGARIVLLAVVMSVDDPIDPAELTKPDSTTITTLQDLVLHSRHAAARSLQIT